ncbi:MAG TPA: RNA pyrophosphohydrolase [Candidatus Acidoferrum sp.]|nr:RNA pyrophosphohydrolase [Candidatus Acidoferrum sp.]
MANIKPEALPYRAAAGMVLLNREGLIFVGKRIDQTQEAWQMPQGGIDDGEDPKTAALRELEEEIGTRNVAVLREHPDWLLYDLPPHLVGVVWEGKYRGQRLKWIAMRFLGNDGEINVATEHAEFSEWKWLNSIEVLQLVVPFKREVYAKALDAFADLIQ